MQKLPAGSEAYDYAYDTAMERIEGQLSDQEELAKQVLSWITCAKRPLTTLELQHALAVEVVEAELDEENISSIEDMVSACAGLVTVDEESRIIRLVHYTTQEYFERTQERWFSNRRRRYHNNLCDVPLVYRLWKRVLSHRFSVRGAACLLNPLYDYAARYWEYHARQSSSLHPEVLTFLKCTIKVEAAVQAMLARKRSWHSNYSQDVPRQMTGLHLAAYLGMTESVDMILQSVDLEVDLKSNNGRTPLSWAAGRGHEAVVKLLLGTGKVEVDSKNN